MADRIKGLKIVLGADASELINAVYKANTEISKTASNLRDVEKALKLDPTNINLLKDKQTALKDAIAETESKIDSEKQALENMKAQGVSETSKEFKDLKTQIDLDESSLKNLKNQMSKFGSVSAQVLQAVGSKVKDVGGKIADVGQNLTTKVTAPIVAGFGAAIKTTADFDAQMSKVQAISGATADEMAQLEAKAREMGATTKFSAIESSEALEYMAMAGWKTDQMLQGIDGIMHLAAASGEELGTTSDIVTDALTAFGYKAEDASRFADILAAAATNANTNVSMMGESFKYVAPVAGSLGYSAEDVSIALGLMANSGIKADMAGTSLRNMFQRLAKPTKESYNAMVQLGLSIADSEGNAYTFREIMDQIRTSFADVNVDLEQYNKSLDAYDEMLQKGEVSQERYDEMVNQLNVDLLGTAGSEKARYAAMLGGTRAMSGLLAIANATEDDYQKLAAAIDNSSDTFAKLADGSVVPLSEALASGQEILEQYNGAAEAMANTMEDNLEGDITKLKSALQELAISIGTLIMPLAREIVDKIQGIVDYMNSLDDGTKKMIMTIAAIVAAVGPILLVVGKLTIGIGQVITAVGAISGAVSAAIPVISGIGATITGTVIPAVAAAALPILGIVAAIAAVVAAIVLCVKHWDEIKATAENAAKAISEAWAKFKEDIEKLWHDILLAIGKAVVNAVKKWQEFKDNTAKAWQDLKTKITETAKGIWTAITTKFSEIQTGVKTKVENIKDNAVKAFTNLKDKISTTVGNIKKSIIDGFQNAVDFITSLPQKALGWGKDIIDNLINGIKEKIGGIADAISGVAETISSFIHFSEPDVGPLKNFHTFMPDMMRELARGIEDGIPKIENAMDSMARSMVPAFGSMTGNTSTQNNSVSINVYGAQGQNMNELAQIIEDKITNNVIRRGIAFG